MAPLQTNRSPSGVNLAFRHLSIKLPKSTPFSAFRPYLIHCVSGIVAIAVCAGVAYHYWSTTDDAMSAIRSGQYQRAVTLLRPAADKGNPQAQTILGNLNYLGLGIRRDYKQAAGWYEKAAKSGDAAAQLNRALIHQQGLGQEPDPISATAWFLLADASGAQRAELYLRRLSGTLNPNKIQQANRMYEQLRSEQSDSAQNNE